MHSRHRQALYAAWRAYGDERQIVSVTEVSAFVSTNAVYRIALDDGANVIAKVSSYGSYFLFAEDHDRLYRLSTLLASTRFSHLLARVLGRGGRAFTWYDGKLWAAFYEEIDRARSLPAILADDGLEAAVHALAEEAAVPLAVGDVPRERFEASRESAAYTVVAETVRAAKGPVAVSAGRSDGTLVLELRTPGVDDLDVVALEDRLGALDGRLAIDRGAGTTTVRAELPCES